ncbi:MAG: hypothetical protein JWM49_827 [Microbacteriaceae bacterium]|nr:hypothetical protein [Microbacteriaceae bacterium]
MTGDAPDHGLAPRTHSALIWSAAGLLAIVVLVLAFLIGTKLPAPVRVPAAASPSATARIAPVPTPTVVAVGPASIGSHRWDALRGGECVDPFTSPFAENFTVVDCAAAHAAQLLRRGTFPAPVAPAATATTATPSPSPSADEYPGLAALQAQIALLCGAPDVIDLAAASAYSDIQFQASYAATAAEWNGGQRDYFCFVNRSSAQPITGSLAGASG